MDQTRSRYLELKILNEFRKKLVYGFVLALVIFSNGNRLVMNQINASDIIYRISWPGLCPHHTVSLSWLRKKTKRCPSRTNNEMEPSVRS